MEVKHGIIMKHIDGYPVNVRYEPVDKLSRAARFPTIEDYQTFITGHYKPPDASKFMPQPIKITYEEVTNDGESRDHETPTRAIPTGRD